MDITIRPLREDEIDITLAFAAREGWNPGLHDGACFHAADPGGFLAAEHQGQVVGCVAAVRYGDGFGFIGLFIVAPAWRSRGIGRRLWEAGMERLAGRVIGLDGVLAQQDNYRRSGFVLAWQNVRFAGVARHDATPEPDAIRPLAEIDFAALLADDERTFAAPREAFWRRWVAMPESSGLAWSADGRLAGWGVIRRCHEGHKIGPLVADDAAVATSLYAALCKKVGEGEAVFLDVPMPNAQAVALARLQGLRSVFETARMYVGPPPELELQRVYGITSFELG